MKHTHVERFGRAGVPIGHVAAVLQSLSFHELELGA